MLMLLSNDICGAQANVSVEVETPSSGAFSFLMELGAQHSYRTIWMMGKFNELSYWFSSAPSKCLDNGEIKPRIKYTFSSGRLSTLGIEGINL